MGLRNRSKGLKRGLRNRHTAHAEVTILSLNGAISESVSLGPDGLMRVDEPLKPLDTIYVRPDPAKLVFTPPSALGWTVEYAVHVGRPVRPPAMLRAFRDFCSGDTRKDVDDTIASLELDIEKWFRDGKSVRRVKTLLVWHTTRTIVAIVGDGLLRIAERVVRLVHPPTRGA